MISVTVSTCAGDKVAPTVSDQLICTQEMANKKAEQELASHILMIKRRELKLPLVVYEIGSLQPLSYSKLQIDGMHRVEAWSLDMTSESISTNVSLMQTEIMCNETVTS